MKLDSSQWLFEVRSFKHSIELLGPRHAGWNEGDHIDGKSFSYCDVFYLFNLLKTAICCDVLRLQRTSLMCLVLMFCVIWCHLWNSKANVFHCCIVCAFMFACFRWFPRRCCGAVLAPCKWASTPSSTPGPRSIFGFIDVELASLNFFPQFSMSPSSKSIVSSGYASKL